MTTIGTILKWLILLPILAAVALIAVANDHMVAVNLNPFDPADPVLRVELALYQIAFLFFVLGALAGGFVIWNGQRRYRREARQVRDDAAFWRARAERQEREQTRALATTTRP
ncbi:LapA family protein [Faunimonas sp. B44]|uniref:LapA family protein n=1 Tax=Faunimonas sp. B44 TaxID=3461493 RepID=UPI004044A108